MKKTIISIRGLSYSYPDTSQVTLDNINLDIYQGEILALLGPNGSGKSTLARHLNGLLKPSRGQVLVDGLDTSDESVLWEVRRRVGMVFQNPDNQLVATLVEEELAFGPENLGVPPEEIRRRVSEISRKFELADLLEFPPHRLSGGQKQRVAIGAVLAINPEVVVLDEPTSMLDPAGRREVLAEVVRLKDLGKTVILVTHDMTEALLADRMAVLEQGRISLLGSPEECFSQSEKLYQMGLEIPPAAKLARRLRGKGMAVPGSMLTVRDWVEYLCHK